MKKVDATATFSLTVQMTSTNTASSYSPTVSIYTKVANGNLVDIIENSAFSPSSISNTNLKTSTSFSIPQPYVIN